MRLDPFTLRQAAARWPVQTLNMREAQSFLRSLAEEAEAQRPAQPATAAGPTTGPDGELWRELQELVEFATRPRPIGGQWISADAIRSLLDDHR